MSREIGNRSHYRISTKKGIDSYLVPFHETTYFLVISFFKASSTNSATLISFFIAYILASFQSSGSNLILTVSLEKFGFPDIITTLHKVII